MDLILAGFALGCLSVWYISSFTYERVEAEFKESKIQDFDRYLRDVECLYGRHLRYWRVIIVVLVVVLGVVGMIQSQLVCGAQPATKPSLSVSPSSNVTPLPGKAGPAPTAG